MSAISIGIEKDPSLTAIAISASANAPLSTREEPINAIGLAARSKDRINSIRSFKFKAV